MVFDMNEDLIAKKGGKVRTMEPTCIMVVDENEDSDDLINGEHIPCYNLEVGFYDPRTDKTVVARCNSTLTIESERKGK